MRRMERSASRCLADAGGEASMSSHVGAGAGAVTATATRGGALSATFAEELTFVSFADGTS